jgi:hypothetical protein
MASPKRGYVNRGGFVPTKKEPAVGKSKRPTWEPKRGDLVVVWRDNGEALVTRVHEAGPGVVWVNGISGFYALSHVRPAAFHESAELEHRGLVLGK